jgi:outer membrane protein OmpA-like peptidoglycan-associated protein
MALYKTAHLFRGLNHKEADLAREVFHTTFPPLATIGITDGLGKDNQIWTVDRSTFDFLQSAPPRSLDRLKYLVNFGEAVRWDLSSPQPLTIAVPGYRERARDVFVHEMTHVWQFYRGMGVKLGSLIAGSGDNYTRGKPWFTYNVEEQATIIEHWNRDRKEDSGEDHEFFPYVHYIIRKEGEYKSSIKKIGVIEIDELWTMDLAQLAVLLAGERGFGIKDQVADPVKLTAKDDSFIVVLNGDVLFDFDKWALKPEADAALQRAAATIKTKSGPRLKSVLINGHTDSVGDVAYNMRLSEQRAKTVADWFFARGYLSRANTKIQGFGKTQPIAPNSDSANRAKNRRVEIYLVNN